LSICERTIFSFFCIFYFFFYLVIGVIFWVFSYFSSFIDGVSFIYKDLMHFMHNPLPVIPLGSSSFLFYNLEEIPSPDVTLNKNYCQHIVLDGNNYIWHYSRDSACYLLVRLLGYYENKGGFLYNLCYSFNGPVTYPFHLGTSSSLNTMYIFHSDFTTYPRPDKLKVYKGLAPWTPKGKPGPKYLCV